MDLALHWSTLGEGMPVAVAVGEGVEVAVLVDVAVCVAVAVLVGVKLGAAVAVGVLVAVALGVIVNVGVRVAVGVFRLPLPLESAAEPGTSGAWPFAACPDSGHTRMASTMTMTTMGTMLAMLDMSLRMLPLRK